MFFHLKLAEVYVIRRKDLLDPRFFLSHFDYETFPFELAKWTAVIERAKEFPTEESVETFKYEFLQSRPCEIVRIQN